MGSAIRLSAAPIDWGVCDLVSGNPLPEEILECANQAGYTGCELGTHGFFGFTADAVMAHYSTFTLTVSASWYDVDLSKPLPADSAAEIDLICSLLQAGGANVINISDKIIPERVAVVSRVDQFPETWWSDENWARVPHTLQEIHEVTSKRGVSVAVHQHVGTHIESKRETERLIEIISGSDIKLCLDTGHLLLGGNDPLSMIAAAGTSVIHIHAKDVDGPAFGRLQAGEIDYFAATGEGLYSDLGSGIVDWAGLRDGLDAIGFSGWVVAEQDRLLVPGSRIPFDANKRNCTFLKGLFRL